MNICSKYIKVENEGPKNKNFSGEEIRIKINLDKMKLKRKDKRRK